MMSRNGAPAPGKAFSIAWRGIIIGARVLRPVLAEGAPQKPPRLELARGTE